MLAIVACSKQDCLIKAENSDVDFILLETGLFESTIFTASKSGFETVYNLDWDEASPIDSVPNFCFFWSMFEMIDFLKEKIPGIEIRHCRLCNKNNACEC